MIKSADIRIKSTNVKSYSTVLSEFSKVVFTNKTVTILPFTM